jgi:Xaa-Pro aminopeptidase
MPDIHAARRARVQDLTAELGADAALITSLVNVRYLTGLASSNAVLLLPAAGAPAAAGAPVLGTDSRYAPAAQRDCPDVELLIERATEPALATLAVARGLHRVGVEEQEMTVERHRALSGSLDLVPLGPMVERLRMVKDDSELALLARACQITDGAFAAALTRLRPGLTERQFAHLLEQEMIALGAEKVAFDTIVASGPNGDTPHHVPTDRPFGAGDLITVDCGAKFGGYHADMTRTVALGDPAGWQRDLYDLVAAAQLAGLAAATDGAELAAVDAAARDVIEAAGHGDHFGHGVGHGVGLEIHEAPMMGHAGTGTLTCSVPVTVEPGVYLPARGGVRIEDTLVVRAGTGAIPGELLTTTTRELLVL